jgi:curved DNA-binding protein CbpA
MGTMDTISVDSKLYDPYFILGVTKEDSSEHITKAFRRKVKKYHPDKYINPDDKKKYECYFKILVESYEYIKERRTGKRSIHIIDKSKYKQEINETKTCNINDFNKEFDSAKGKMSGKDPERLKKTEDYDNLKIQYVNLFDKKKFSNKQFNKMFEWHKSQNKKDNANSKQLMHKTTDGFYAQNSNQISDCSLVSSYNGLMIVEDDLDERGIGYWGNDYSDYLMVHDGIKNPTKKIKIPRNFKEDKSNIVRKSSRDTVDVKDIIKNKIFNDEKDILYKKQYDDLVEKERLDKELVMKHIHKYNKTIHNAALNNELEKSQTYIEFLQKNIKSD